MCPVQKRCLFGGASAKILRGRGNPGPSQVKPVRIPAGLNREIAGGTDYHMRP